jgi:hypothetical protein
VRAVKNHDAEQMRICKSYVRWKWRQRVLTILKVWRHQALYGRIDGLYSRQMLLKTLAEQKFAANLLEKHMSDQTLELEECRTIVAREIGESYVHFLSICKPAGAIVSWLPFDDTWSRLYLRKDHFESAMALLIKCKQGCPVLSAFLILSHHVLLFTRETQESRGGAEGGRHGPR